MKLLKNFNMITLIKAIQFMGKRSKVFVLIILGFNIVEAIGAPLMAYGMRGAVNAAALHDNTLFLQSVLLIMINRILWSVYAPISAYLCDWASKRTIRDTKTSLVGHLIRLPQKYHDSRPKGEMLSLMSNDMDGLQNIYDWTYFQVIRCSVIGLSGICTMLVIDWRFALIVIALGLAAVYTTSFFAKRLEESGRQLQSQLAGNSAGFYELVKAAKAIRLLSLSALKAVQFHGQAQQEAEVRTETARTGAKMNSCAALINSLSYILILITGTMFVYFRLTDWGNVAAMIELKGAADCLFSELGIHLALMQTNLAGVQRILGAENEPEESINPKHYAFAADLGNPDTVLSLSGVGFSYDEQNEVLRDTNLALETGKLTVLLGESGAGKSTLMKILLSLYEPVHGMVLYKDNTSEGPVPTVSIETLREKMAYVPQDAMLFRGSIYDNIACGKDQASYQDVISASRAAGAHSFIIQMPDGYDTTVVDNGKSLSGGQRQRIAIARALLKKAPVLLLDEVTSALDMENERKILQTIQELKKNYTVLFITHKQYAASFGDSVIRLNKL
jgi:ATP-binding cassette subfamily B protein